ncbi:hypothetical protein DFJ58DRAFT_912596 [Suillus subalutaceus]|uniref:uncharacterized protein n=1 Tax=Suillus subalutaceus TaxID=48586 RepID=UPI001B86457B|nr:uncharacterized protein DFJ58DRAFT_912596 [Suillus subalutaceus]KAG1862014.1 hypothetical protein DFJ58DRAFT_912596 [Suillus subalutaceus]
MTSRHIFLDQRHAFAHSTTSFLIEKRVMHSLIMPGNAYYTYLMLEQVFWEIVSRSVKDMSVCLECKLNAPAELLPCAAYTKEALHDSKGKRKGTNELGALHLICEAPDCYIDRLFTTNPSSFLKLKSGTGASQRATIPHGNSTSQTRTAPQNTTRLFTIGNMCITEPNNTVSAPWTRPFNDNAFRDVLQAPDIKLLPELQPRQSTVDAMSGTGTCYLNTRAQPLPRKEKMWSKKQARDFVWD